MRNVTPARPETSTPRRGERRRKRSEGRLDALVRAQRPVLVDELEAAITAAGGEAAALVVSRLRHENDELRRALRMIAAMVNVSLEIGDPASEGAKLAS